MQIVKLSSCLLLVLALPACRVAKERAPSSLPQGESRAALAPALVAPPLRIEGSAFEAAAELELPFHEATERPGLHNVFWLSPRICSGSEPEGREALEELARQGVRTLISVDGKVPDGAGAAELGMRYVHIPIQYSGITEEERLQLAKTFRELEAPFYVHCFHGKHRGPAGAAVGRVVLDGVERQVAIAEMRQYSGTSRKYEGLYEVIASGYLPTASETEGSDFDFADARAPEGLVEVMVALSRGHDRLAALATRDWSADPAHPDVDALNEAQKMLDAYSAALALDEVQGGPEDLRELFEGSRASADQLTRALRAPSPERAEASESARAAFLALKADCTACHRLYRQ